MIASICKEFLIANLKSSVKGINDTCVQDNPRYAGSILNALITEGEFSGFLIWLMQLK
jgi:hypothetical protein